MYVHTCILRHIVDVTSSDIVLTRSYVVAGVGFESTPTLVEQSSVTGVEGYNAEFGRITSAYAYVR